MLPSGKSAPPSHPPVRDKRPQSEYRAESPAVGPRPQPVHLPLPTRFLRGLHRKGRRVRQQQRTGKRIAAARCSHTCNRCLCVYRIRNPVVNGFSLRSCLPSRVSTRDFQTLVSHMGVNLSSGRSAWPSIICTASGPRHYPQDAWQMHGEA